jgi:hypothetical protein
MTDSWMIGLVRAECILGTEGDALDRRIHYRCVAEDSYSNFACLPLAHTMPVCSLALNPSFS